MPSLLNLVYLAVLFLAAPWLAWRSLRTGRYRHGWRVRFFGCVPQSPRHTPLIWFHAVSVGEVHLLGPVVAGFQRRHPDWRVVISTTTDTGQAEARKRFPSCRVINWPFDFSWAVRQVLQRIAPTLVVLVEGELWPNFLRETRRQRVPVVVINARLSPRSFRRYARFGWLTRCWLTGITHWAVQTDEVADRWRQLGVPPNRITVTGSVKYDGVPSDRSRPEVQRLRQLFHIQENECVWVVGSTQPPEEALTLGIWQRLRAEFPAWRLIVVPRHPDRFDAVAELLHRSAVPFVRRSELAERPAGADSIILVDTIGELTAVWALADVALVGGSFDGQRGGQNMIEPAGCGCAVVFGPHVWNFRDPARRLVECGAAIQTDATQLESVLRELFRHPERRQNMGTAGRRCVIAHQGATERTLDVLDRVIGRLASIPASS